MDALTDVLRTVQLKGSLYFHSELSAPWAMSVPATDKAQFHIVRRGRCWLTQEGGKEKGKIFLDAGDIVVLPHGDGHIVSDERDTPPVPITEILERNSKKEKNQPLVYGGGGEVVKLICGYFEFAGSKLHPLLSVLPRIILIPGEGGRAQHWLESTMDLIAHEIQEGRPGCEIVVDRLTETMFIQVLRSHLGGPAEGLPSWLNGLRDTHIARSLALIHRQPEHRWTVEELAQNVGLSRSGFSSKFAELVGEPPLKYLTRWRMQLAASQLADGLVPIADIADKVGYQAEAAFSKVFKKAWGVSPRNYRKDGGATATPGF